MRKTVEKWRSLEKRFVDIQELLELAESERDSSLASQIAAEIVQAVTLQDEMEFELAFSGRMIHVMLILSITPGAGGTESQDWADMLLRMYLRRG